MAEIQRECRLRRVVPVRGAGRRARSRRHLPRGGRRRQRHGSLDDSEYRWLAELGDRLQDDRAPGRESGAARRF